MAAHRAGPIGDVMELRGGTPWRCKKTAIGPNHVARCGASPRSDGHWLDQAAFDDYSITSGRVVTGTNPASGRSATERVVKVFDNLELP